MKKIFIKLLCFCLIINNFIFIFSRSAYAAYASDSIEDYRFGYSKKTVKKHLTLEEKEEKKIKLQNKIKNNTNKILIVGSIIIFRLFIDKIIT